jgi:hypothetical protein
METVIRRVCLCLALSKGIVHKVEAFYWIDSRQNGSVDSVLNLIEMCAEGE